MTFLYLKKKKKLFVLGLPVRTDLDLKTAKIMARHILPIRDAARSAIRCIDPCDELVFLRIKTTKQECFVSYDEKFALLSIQKMEQ